VFFTAGSAIRQASSKSGLTILLAAAALLGTAASPASAKGPATESRLPAVKVDDLPMQAVDTLLPAAPRSYYREYTVKTVGARDRGARRIVCGGTEVKLPDACFYTDDHYASFRRIVK